LSSIKCGIKVCGLGYSCNFVNCRGLPSVRRFLLTKCCESSYLTLVFIVLQTTDWLMIVTEINKVGLQCKKLTPISCPVEAVQILVKSLEECNCDETRFSTPHRPAVLHDFFCWLLFFGLHKIKSHLGDSNNTYTKHVCEVDSGFTFSFSPIPQLS